MTDVSLIDRLKALRADAEKEVRLNADSQSENYWLGNADAFTVAINEAARHPSAPDTGLLIEKLETLGAERCFHTDAFYVLGKAIAIVREFEKGAALVQSLNTSPERVQKDADIEHVKASDAPVVEENKRLKEFIHSIFVQCLNDFGDPFMGDDDESHVKTMKHCYDQINAFAKRVPDWGKWDYSKEAWHQGYKVGKGDAPATSSRDCPKCGLSARGGPHHCAPAKQPVNPYESDFGKWWVGLNVEFRHKGGDYDLAKAAWDAATEVRQREIRLIRWMPGNDRSMKMWNVLPDGPKQSLPLLFKTVLVYSDGRAETHLRFGYYDGNADAFFESGFPDNPYHDPVECWYQPPMPPATSAASKGEA